MSRTHTAILDRVHRRAGFTLVELLVVIAIIALLMGILIPSVTAARNAAKRATARNTIKLLSGGLTVFKNDNEGVHPQTNGYPESAFAEDPATIGSQKIYGAHWLVRSLVGEDFNGFIPRRIVPMGLQRPDQLTEEQVRWYHPEEGDPVIHRIAPYIPVDRVETLITEDLLLPPAAADLPQPTDPTTNPSVRHAPVFIDPWGGAFLYYASNSFGKTLCANNVSGPKDYYTHEDNELFTGSNVSTPPLTGVYKNGAISDVCPSDIDNIDETPTWARYLHNERIHQQTNQPNNNAVFKPVPYNRDSFLLISPGLDGNYGTSDDINNFAN